MNDWQRICSGANTPCLGTSDEVRLTVDRAGDEPLGLQVGQHQRAGARGRGVERALGGAVRQRAEAVCRGALDPLEPGGPGGPGSTSGPGPAPQLRAEEVSTSPREPNSRVGRKELSAGLAWPWSPMFRETKSAAK